MKFLTSCKLCPRRCGIAGTKKKGFCGAGEKIRIALVSLHKWEEPCLVGEKGAGTVFFSHCNLKCVFCQNFEISSGGRGKDFSVEELAEIFLRQQEIGAANIELVTPTHYVPQICRALDLAKKSGLNLPIVYNSNAYENPETIDLLKNRVDVFLPDLKYFDNRLAETFSNAPNYFEIAFAAIKKMFELVGEPEFDEGGKMIKGVIVRHLILPNCRKDSIEIVSRLYETFGDKIYLSLMNQYTPVFRAGEFKKINRRLTTFEYDSVVNHALKIGVKNCFVQVGKTADEKFIPKWDY